MMEIILAPILILALTILPWTLALASKKASGTHKLVWFLMSFFISWLGYFVYYFLVIRDLHNNQVR